METPVMIHAQTSPLDHPKSNPLPMILAFVFVVIAGVGTGYLISQKNPAELQETSKSASMIKSDSEAGTTDTKTFKDFATGTLEAGGINGEGTHKLVRPGGVSQTVYLISSLVDLDGYVGKNVEIYGQTIRAKSAGWLMDVGRIKVLQ